MRALLVVDLQLDFLPNGALAVYEGDLIIPRINAIQERFELIVATQDWHPLDHQSFASQHSNQQVYDLIELQGIPQVLWPDHCVQGTVGASFSEAWNSNSVAAVFRKGMNKQVDSYSGFYDNNKIDSTGLYGFLNDKGVTEVYVCGLAAEFCVFYTAMDAKKAGFKTYFLDFATKPISAEGLQQAKAMLIENEITIVNTSEELMV
ncbi:bifunctional nicotinamidase/pyrazinamidase [Myroides sp. 1354]|uniref:bifunctional nicotinamidase/pyrazinamidase n=1 Tax=unclassified Myroides TaxID=2642485 RepID=UPI002574D8EC|nr:MULTISPECIES: bifunctional nicotinamidase/pyrazinamidase [unclassified Myroides]MDM1045832.1 bifunctional nicotinamidase/pyrazinamidase [Myroides sp. R163-1]MDM1055713.1 bifunctional nicotinamidase/pyrazinamidase [Myroides sp. 1354]MDM1069805.1 bifunctional nicotinamidase/pyrazinamidase [Myroides sp. 1372]